MKRSSKTVFIFFFMACFISGCSQYTLVPMGPQQVGQFSFSMSRDWNKVPNSSFYPSGVVEWTLDGVALNSITFWSGLGDEATLFKSRKKDPYPVYSSDMLPTDIQEWVQQSYAKAIGEGQALVTSQNLAPVTIAGKSAFQFEVSYATQDNVNYRANVIAIPEDGQLNLIVFRAVSIHYFDDLQSDFQQVVETLTL